MEDDFWRHTTLDQLTREQWEALCDRCGRCCLQKLKSPTTGKIIYTRVACYLLDTETCRCAEYEFRHALVPDCVPLHAANIPKLRWLPKTCAYRLVAEGRSLPQWHPLITKDPQSVHRAGISIRHRAISEVHVHPDDLLRFKVKEGF
jgi:uncharacterized protein